MNHPQPAAGSRNLKLSRAEQTHAWGSRTIGFAVAAMMLICGHVPAKASVVQVLPPVTTEHNDNNRTGDYLSETTLTPANVNQSQFGKLFAYNLDDESYSQPLWVPNVLMAVDNNYHNVVVVATVNNSVYAFDADNNLANNGQALWHDNLTPAGGRAPNVEDADNEGACGGDYTDFSGQYGIVGTPVIDPSTDTIYVVARTVENGAFIQRLHALDLTSGAEKFGGPVVISGSYQGANFDPALNNQRPALALINGVVYIGWSSHCDNGDYHGFLMGYNAATLQQVAVWASTNGNGGEAGIWQGGQAVTADSNGDLYLMTGNGTWDGIGNFGESFVKLSPTLSVLDYFTPSNYATLNGADTDLGSAGCLLIPGSSQLFGGGKEGKVYLLNTSALGEENSTDNVVQEFQATFPPAGDTGHIHGGPVYFNSANGQFLYLWGENDYLHVYKYNNGTINSTPVANSTMTSPVTNTGMPGGFLSISANGNQNGIVWGYTPYNGNANSGTVAGILHAFDAQTFTNGSLNELWNSEQNHPRDTVGNYAKFTYPTIANGKVYVSTFGSAHSGSGQLIAYGEGPSQVTSAPAITPNGGTVPQQVSITDTTPNATIYYTLDGSSPNPGAADTFIYTTQLTVSACETITAMAVVNQTGWLPSTNTTAYFTGTGTPGTGTGLTATYYSNINLTGNTVKRVDPTVNFVWPTADPTPAPGIGPDDWSASWTGFVQPEFTDTYTFTTVTDDGVQLWVNGQLIINDWVQQAPTAKSGTIVLQAGQKYSIVMDYFQAGGGAEAQLYWQSTCQAQQIIPASQLYPTTGQVALPSISPGSGQYSGLVPVTITDSTPGASIYYTTNGTAPTSASTLYTSGFTVPSGTEIQAIGIENGYINSAVNTVLYQGSLPFPWQDIDVGSVGLAGSGTWANGVFYQLGSGADIWSNADAFNFIYQPLNGNGTLTARVVSIGDSDPWSKAGVMIRASLTGPSAEGMAAVTYGNGTVYQDRETTGAGSNNWSGPWDFAPYWIQITRSGNTLTGSASPDGVNWTQIASDTVTLPSTAYVGLALSAHNNTLLNNAQFDNVSITYSQTTAMPSIAPNAGPYTSSVPITITDSTQGASIYYTIDGSTPSPGVGTTQLYATSFNLPASATVNAIATSPGNGPSAVASQSYTVQAPPPSISPNSGVFTTSVQVSITSQAGTAVYYTVDGSTPVPGVGTTQLYFVPFTLNSSATVNAIAIIPGGTPSTVASQTYMVQTAAPSISPNAGTYTSSVQVSITGQAGSAIYYTVDGSVPSPGAGTTQLYSTPFTLNSSATVKAIAIISGRTPSMLVSQAYTVQAPAPSISTTSSSDITSVQVVITDPVSGTPIYYTLDGSTPAPGVGTTQLYSGPITLTKDTTANAIAEISGGTPSTMVTASFDVKADTPIFTPGGGYYTAPVTVTITDNTPGVSFYYTTDGSSPNPGAAGTSHYHEPIVIKPGTFLQAVATLSGAQRSNVRGAHYDIPTATAPTIAPNGGHHMSSSTITLTDTTAGASMYYTTDGTTPSPGVGTTKKYTVPFVLSVSATVNAIATAPGYNPSGVDSAAFTIQTSKPGLTPNGGTITGPTLVSITCATPGATIYYTTNGTTPVVPGGTTPSIVAVGGTMVYTGQFTVEPGANIQAIAVVPGQTASEIASVTFN